VEFDHLPGQKFSDFSEIRIEIKKRTSELTNDKDVIVETPIKLKIYSPDVITLTLADLPGLVKVIVQILCIHS